MLTFIGTYRPKEKRNARRQSGCLRRPFQIAEKRREVKGKGERERHIQLNVEFQRIVRRDKKAFLCEQCEEIEGNNRMRKTRGLFKKIGDTKRTFHARMGTIKDRNSMDLTETENIKKRCQGYTEELYKNGLNDPGHHDGVVTHLSQTSWSVKSSVP